MAFDFHQQLGMSQSEKAHRLAMKHLRRLFPDALDIRQAHMENDKAGADYLLEYPHCQFRTVDVKVRGTDYLAMGQPEIALEVWSNREYQRPGWILDTNKATDWVLFVWLDTGRADLFAFRMLQSVTKANLTKWQQEYTPATQQTGNNTRAYTSQVLFIDGYTLHAEIYRWQTNRFAA
jgi:hypothetical protein